MIARKQNANAIVSNRPVMVNGWLCLARWTSWRILDRIFLNLNRHLNLRDEIENQLTFWLVPLFRCSFRDDSVG